MKKAIFVSGGNRGIGHCILKKFYQNSWETHSCSKSENPGNDYAHYTYHCDISNPNDVRKMFSDISQNTAKLHCLVNNAGIAGANDINAEEGIDQWEKIISTNLNGPYYVSKYGLPFLSRGSNIINITSVLAHTGIPDQTAYCSAKHGLLGLTRSLAKALAPLEIKVNAISPGWVNTDMANNRSLELGVSLDQLAKQIPLGRVIDPEEIAESVFFLAANKLPNYTGQSMIIDGGFLS